MYYGVPLARGMYDPWFSCTPPYRCRDPIQLRLELERHRRMQELRERATQPEPRIYGPGDGIWGLQRYIPAAMALVAPYVNSYRRLSRHTAAPINIEWGHDNRTCALRVVGHGESLRLENRVPGGDVNPYLAIFTVFKTGLEGPLGDFDNENKKHRTRFLPDNIYDAIRLFKASKYAQELLGAEVHEKYAELKLASAERCAKALGTRVKRGEIQFHHEVTNQYLWSRF